jgi:RNA polymerase sigma-70 factor (ECF subfamily)
MGIGQVYQRHVSEPETIDNHDVRLAQAGDAAAVERLFRAHWPTAWRVALAITGRKALAEEVAQEGFISAFGAIDRFDPSRPFAPWLKRIVTNGALNVMRSERRLVLEEGPPAIDRQDPEADHADLLEAVAALGPDQRVVVALRCWLDNEPAEIAGLLDIPIGTVNSRLGRARVELRARLEVEDADDLDGRLIEAREALAEPDSGASERVLAAIRASTSERAAEEVAPPARRPRPRFTRRRGHLALAGTVVVAGAAAAAVSSFGGGPAAPVACTVLAERGTNDQLRYAYYGPDVALDSSGRALVAWLAASRTVQASSRSASGDWTSPENVSGTLYRRGRANGVDVALTDDGSGLVAWSGYTTQVAIWSGSRWSAPSLLAQPGYRSDFTAVPQIEVNTRGEALVLFDAARRVTYGSGGLWKYQRSIPRLGPARGGWLACRHGARRAFASGAGPGGAQAVAAAGISPRGFG